MKNSILSLLLFLCMGLFVSCSEDEKADDGKEVNQVRISAIFPQELAATRTKGAATHKLRCILELWSKDSTPKLVYREEVVAEPDAAVKSLPIDFQINEGTYDCLIWADYIDATATATAGEKMSNAGDTPSVHYADKYYDTSDLKNVTVKEVNSLLNNDACDACFYCGELVKQEGAALQQDITLERPISKVTLKEKDLKEFSLLQGLTASFNVPSSFNVATGKASTETTTISHTHSEFDPVASPGGALFSAYIFANAADHMLGEVELTLTTARLPLQHIVVPDIIPLIRGQHVQVAGNMMGISPDPDPEFEITYDINVTDWTEIDQNIAVTDVMPKVGDFYYKDGTYASNYISDANNPCIGVVFAVAHDGGNASEDVPANYVGNDGTPKLEKVRGWVVAAYDLMDKSVTGAGSSALLPTIKSGATIPEAVKKKKGDIAGFKNTEAFRAMNNNANYPVLEAVISYNENEKTKAPADCSGWYWGADEQYRILTEVYAVKGDKSANPSLIIGKSLKVLAENNAGKLFGAGGNWRRYWTSTYDTAKSVFYITCFDPSNSDYSGVENWGNSTDTRNVRAILTF